MFVVSLLLFTHPTQHGPKSSLKNSPLDRWQKSAALPPSTSWLSPLSLNTVGNYEKVEGDATCLMFIRRARLSAAPRGPVVTQAKALSLSVSVFLLCIGGKWKADYRHFFFCKQETKPDLQTISLLISSYSITFSKA